MHRGFGQSRRDDVESLAHVLVYFLRGGRLPWQHISTGNGVTKGRRNQLIGEQKALISAAELCAGHAPEWASFLEYTRRLAFKEVIAP